MEKICFNNNDEIVDKLKEIGIFTKTKTSKDLGNIKYKEISNGEIIIHKCEIIGFNRKQTNNGCIDAYYENLIIKSKEKTFNINIDYFKEMQTKRFGIEN